MLSSFSQLISSKLKQIVQSEALCTSANSETIGRPSKELATTPEQDMEVDSGHIPTTSQDRAGTPVAPKEAVKTHVDDSIIQIKAGKAEVKFCDV